MTIFEFESAHAAALVADANATTDIKSVICIGHDGRAYLSDVFGSTEGGHEFERGALDLTIDEARAIVDARYPGATVNHARGRFFFPRTPRAVFERGR